MPVDLYMDHHVPHPITAGLRVRGVSVLTAHEDAAERLADPDLLDRATTLGRVLFSQDEDLLIEAAYRQAAGLPFGGVIFVRQQRLSTGECIDQLEIVAKVSDLDEMRNRVLYLPI
jgi:hypothetical protein